MAQKQSSIALLPVVCVFLPMVYAVCAISILIYAVAMWVGEKIDMLKQIKDG